MKTLLCKLLIFRWYPERDLNPQGLSPTDFKSVAFANFAIRAFGAKVYIYRS